MNIPARHHVVPQMLQKRFTDEDGMLWCIRQRGSTPFRTNPINLFVERQFYSSINKDGQFDPAIEVELGRLEGEIDPFLDRIIADVRAGRSPTMNRHERNAWDAFAFTQIRRVPEIHSSGPLKGVLDATMDKIRDDLTALFPALSDEIVALTTGTHAMRMKHNARVSSLTNFDGKAFKEFQKRGFATLHIQDACRLMFIIGSNPVSRLAGPGLANPNHEIWLPVAPDVAFGIHSDPSFSLCCTVNDTNIVRRLNRAIATQSSAIASSNLTLLQSLRPANRPRPL